jgi:EpsI family protein
LTPPSAGEIMMHMVRLAAIWPLLPLAALAAATLAAIGSYWGASEELLNRALIAIASAWLLYRSRSALFTGSAGIFSRVAGFADLVAALAMIPLGWFVLVQIGPRPVVLWWLTVGWLAAAAGTVLIQNGWRSLRTLAFPLLFLIFALPMPQRIAGPLQAFLQEWVTTLSALSLRTLGYACERYGFVLSLPSGKLGVIEACSGIRSVTALTAVAALIAYWRHMGLVRGGCYVALSLPVIVAANVLRITVTGVLLESIGSRAIDGPAHDLLGFSAILVALAGLVGLARLFGKTAASADAASPVTRGPPPSRLAFALCSTTVLASLLAVGVPVVLDGRPSREAPLQAVAMNLGEWRGEDAPIDDAIRDTLGYDRAMHRVYRNAIGQDVHVWVIYWSRVTSEKGYHHPDLCLGNQGWTLVERRLVSVPLANGLELPVTYRRFRQNGRAEGVGYWTQEGPRIWTDADEEQARAGGSYRWLLEGLSGRMLTHDARLSVLVDTELWGSNRYAEQALLSFCRIFADELYRVLPWANPE